MWLTNNMTKSKSRRRCWILKIWRHLLLLIASITILWCSQTLSILNLFKPVDQIHLSCNKLCQWVLVFNRKWCLEREAPYLFVELRVTSLKFCFYFWKLVCRWMSYRSLNSTRNFRVNTRWRLDRNLYFPRLSICRTESHKKIDRPEPRLFRLINLLVTAYWF
jgi:hypothetical protein